MSDLILKLSNICKSYKDTSSEIQILNNISFELAQGESMAILGQSGSGKTTLMQIIGLIDDYNSGKLEICGKDVSQITEKGKDNIRKFDISFVHQFHHLFPEFSAIENVTIPQLNIGIEKSIAISNAKQILTKLGLENKINASPWQLSGGERQRVAIARAIINKPKLILADEPTGSLDPKNSTNTINLLFELCKEYQASLLLVTHNHDIAKLCGKVFDIS